MVSHVILLGVGEQHTKHVTYKIADHFVWCPTYRKAVLTGDVAQFVESEMRRLCDGEKLGIGALLVLIGILAFILITSFRMATLFLPHSHLGTSCRRMFV